jgi:hypothetical protein
LTAKIRQGLSTALSTALKPQVRFYAANFHVQTREKFQK